MILFTGTLSFADQEGDNIAKKTYNLKESDDSYGIATMVIIDNKGNKKTRKIEMFTKKGKDGQNSFIQFLEPADVKGTAFLTYSHAIKPDEQWLYLPALKRVKRINSKNKSGPFMGSEFAYEDLASQEIEKYTYKYIRDEECNGADCFVIERYPAYEHSGYTRQLVWINKDKYVAEKIEFYDRKNDLLKTLVNSNYKQYLGQYWRADEMLMENHQTGKSTFLTWKDYNFKTGLDDKDFSRNSLKRAR